MTSPVFIYCSFYNYSLSPYSSSFGFAGCPKNDGCAFGKDISPPVFENSPPEFEENKLEPVVFVGNNELLIGFVLNPPCERLENSGVLPKLPKREVFGAAFYNVTASLFYLVSFLPYEFFAAYCLSF